MFEVGHSIFQSEFKLESWGAECKDKIRRLGKITGDLEFDPKLPAGWTVRRYGKTSKSASQDYLTPDRKYYVRSYEAVIKYMKLSGIHSDEEISKAADSLQVNMVDIEIENTDRDNILDANAKIEDEKLLKEADDDMAVAVLGIPMMC